MEEKVLTGANGEEVMPVNFGGLRRCLRVGLCRRFEGKSC